MSLIRVLVVPLLLLALVSAPLLFATALALQAAWDAQAWRALFDAPRVAAALGASLWTGLLSTALSLALAAWLLSHLFPSRAWNRALRRLPALLALPHAAFAIGLAFLVAPSGWLLRAVSPWATGLDAPPPWATTQDRWGLGLIAVLVAKEVPFLLWAAAAQLRRADVAERLARELDAARCMGYTPQRAWWCLVWPQLAGHLRWPVLAVLAYGLTVVDVALIIGPASPPTLAVLAWGWLLDADPAVNAQGAAAAWLLAGALAACALLAGQAQRLWPRRFADGRRGSLAGAVMREPGLQGLRALIALYLAVLIALAASSVAGAWPFPDFWPQRWTLQAWQSVAASAPTLGDTLTLALASAGAAMLWSVAWMESTPAHWDDAARRVSYGSLVLPALVWVPGLHALALALGWDAQWRGVWLAHSLAALPYVLLTLAPAYRGFDNRLRQASRSMGKGRVTFLLRIKWPLLRAPLATALAVAFAVSVAQYLPTLFVGAGRYATVTTEAVTLAAGGQRSRVAAYAWLQWVLPMAGFGLAAWAGRARRFRNRAP